MANRLEQHDDDELSEILKLAVRKQAGDTSDLRQRLLAVGGELGISPEAIVAAEVEYRRQSEQKRELELYTKESRNALRLHFVTYLIVNICLLGINLMTWQDDHEIWFPYVVLGWGIGMGIHAFVAMQTVDWDNSEFQKWRADRAEKGLSPF